MTRRIIVPCAPDGAPFRRHRWQWRKVYDVVVDGQPQRVTDRWCERCGRWMLDVIEQKEVNTP